MANFFTSLFSSRTSASDVPAAEQSTKNNSKHFDILKYDGVRAQKIGKLDYAIRCYKEALLLNEDAETLNYLVNVYAQKGMIDEAEEITTRLVALDPTEVDALLLAANLRFMQEAYGDVIKQTAHILTLEPTNYLAQVVQAKAHKKKNDLLSALLGFTQTIALQPDFMQAYLLRAEVLHAMNQNNEALEDIEKILADNSEDENAYLLRAEIHEALGNMEQAAADYRQTLTLNPFNEHAMLLLGQLLIKQNELDAAILHLTDVIETNGELAEAYNERGRAYFLQGNKKAAAEDMKIALSLNPAGETAKRFEGEIKNFDDMYKGGIF